MLEEQYRDEAQYEKTGYHLVVLAEELIQKNLTTKEEIDQYVDRFDYSTYSDIYSEIKEKTQDKEPPENESLKQKVKKVRGTKK